MKIERFYHIRWWFLAAVLVLSGAFLTGCTQKEENVFLEEIREEDVSKTVNAAEEKSDSEKEETVPQLTVNPQITQNISEALESTTDPEEQKTVTEKIYVDVCGAVKKPGVVSLRAGSRVFQAISKAGGYLPEAAKRYVNGAMILNDGQQIYVPTEEEMTEPPVSAADNGSTGNDAAIQDGGETAEDKIDLNTADKTQLMTLTGIGESKAEAILAYRDEKGGFSSVEELMNVQGIKEGTFTKIKDDIVVR